MKGRGLTGEPNGPTFDGIAVDDACGSVLSWRDLAHSETPVVALDRPVPGIARCVVAPVPLLWLPAADRPARHPVRRVRCLAVDDTGNLAAPEAVFTGDAEALLACIRHHLSTARRSSPAPHGSPLLPDTAAALRDPANWRLWAPGGPDQPLAVSWQWATLAQRTGEPGRAPAPLRRALQRVRQLGHRLQWCVEWVIGRLPGPLGRVMLERPDLRHGLARHLLEMADRHGGGARRYAEQALQCEPLPMLRWIAEDGTLAQTLFTGRSMPEALCRAAGISAAAARHVSRQANAIAELPPSAWLDVLALLDRLPAHRRPFGPWQWGRLAALCREVAQATDPRDPDARQVALGAMLAGARRLPLGRSAEQPQESDWQSVFADAASPEQLAALVCRLHRETSADGPLAALRQPGAAAGTGRDDADGGSLAARLVDAVGQGSAERFGDLWLQLLPAATPMRVGGCTLRLLGSMREVLRCGRALHNCARHPEAVLAYLVSLRCLVAIEDGGGRPLGLVAVLLERSGEHLLLQAGQALGPRNRPLPAGAAAAADKFVDELAGEPARFENFVRVGEALGRLGSKAGH